MILARTIGTLFLFLFSFLITWIYVYGKKRDWRSSFISAFLYVGAFVWFLTEVLSFFKKLEPAGILCGWIGYTVLLTILLFLKYIYKKDTIPIKRPRLFPFRWEYGVLGIIFFVTFFIAVIYPPNNWDSMTYHLPRIEHWLQNKSIGHYYTAIDRQLFSAPFAEILILQGRALSGDDYLMNLVQWFSFLGSVIGISKIVSRLGMNKTMQITSALFFATVPMAILQASSTQNDLVETFCLICMVERFLAWRKTGAFFDSLLFGLALGLSILTKGTAYPIAFPFVLCFAAISIKHFRKRFTGAFFAAMVCLTLNLPHYARNYITFGNPLEAHSSTVSNFSIKSFVITFIAEIYVNAPFPVPPRLMAKLHISPEEIWNFLGAGSEIFPYGTPHIPSIRGFIRNLFSFHEDSVQTFFHILLVIITFILLFHKNHKKEKWYGIIVISSWCMFAYCIPWQPWVTRLQLPLFALSAPVFALVFENKEKYRRFFMLPLIGFAVLPLLLNQSRPLLPVSPITHKTALWNTSRDELVFQNKYNDYSSYTGACNAIVQSGAQNTGIIIGGDSWEYPLWRYIRKNTNKKIRITHVKENSIDNDVDILFILGRQEVVLIHEEESLDKEDIPLVLCRNIQNNSEWNLLCKGK